MSALLWLNRVPCPGRVHTHACDDMIQLQCSLTSQFTCLDMQLQFHCRNFHRFNSTHLHHCFQSCRQCIPEAHDPTIRACPEVIYRTPRGEHPHHTPRGGRSDRTDNRQGYFRREEKETRDRNLDDAFNAQLPALKLNTADFKEAFCFVLRKRTALRSLTD